MPWEPLFYHLVHNLLIFLWLVKCHSVCKKWKHVCSDKYCLWAVEYPAFSISFFTVYIFQYLTGSCHRKRLNVWSCTVTLSWLIFKDEYLEFYLKWHDVPRQCVTASLLDRWRKTKAFITKRCDCLKRKGKSRTDTSIYVHWSRSSSNFAQVIDFEFELFVKWNDEAESWSSAF